MKIALILDDYESAKDILVKQDDKGYLYELRLDLDKKLLDLLNSDLLKAESTILTYRSIREGGNGEDDIQFVNNLLNYDVRFLDLELYRDEEILQAIIKTQIKVKASKIIVSRHNYKDSMVEDYRNYLQKTEFLFDNVDIKKYNFVRKYVGLPVDSLEIVEALDLKPKNSILLGVRENGILSRTMGKFFDQQLIFGATNNKLNIIDFETLEKANFDDVLRFGLIGKKIDYSYSPILHRLFLQDRGLNGYYHKFELQNEQRLRKFIDKLMEMDFKGLNVTNPYKRSLIDKMNKLSTQVENVQALNTIEIVNGELIGHNTDISGFSSFWNSLGLPKDMKINIIGAGGASIAVTHALLSLNYEIIVYNRNKDRFSRWPEEILSQIEFAQYNRIKTGKADCLINATPMKYDDLRPIVNNIGSITMGIDLSYSVIDTDFVKLIRESGAKALDGKQMLFHQAVDAFEIWTKTDLNREILWNLFEKELEKIG